MKTKLYTLITGLLMAVSITSYGQEIVSQFTLHTNNSYIIGCDLYENQDGTLLIGTTSSSTPYFYDSRFTIIKTTPEGETINSLDITTPEGMNGQNFTSVLERADKRFLFPVAKDMYVAISHFWNINGNTYNYYVREVIVNNNLDVINDVTVQVAQTGQDAFTWDKWFIDTNNDLIVSFWIGETFHIMRIGLDGTVKNAVETSELFPPDFEYGYTVDTLLWYSGFGIYKNNPMTYYKLGGFCSESGGCPVYCYFFDTDFNIIGTNWYEEYDENIFFSGSNIEHIVPFDEDSYLMASQMEYSNNEAGCALVKYDMNHNPICISPQLGNYDYPLDTKITSNGTIYQYHSNVMYGTIWAACLDPSLNLIWDIELEAVGINGLNGSSLISKANGDIIVGFACVRMYSQASTDIFVYTIRNTPANTTEKTNCDLCFSFYPSPVKDHLTLRFDDGAEPESVELYDLAGRLVSTKPNGLESIDMNAMPSGVYLLRVTLKDGTCYHEKIVKE